MLSLQYVCIYVHLCVCVCAKWASRPFCCLWWMFLIERQRSSVPRVLFLSLAHGSNSAAFLRYQTHVTLPTVSLSAPRRVCTLSPPRLFIPRANRKLLQRVPDWLGGSLNPREIWERTIWFIKSKCCRKQHPYTAKPQRRIDLPKRTCVHDFACSSTLGINAHMQAQNC